MDLNWYEGILYGLFSGLTDILPVSSHAHKFLMGKLFGFSEEHPVMGLMMDIGILLAVYVSCQTHIVRILRARRLARIPKRRRKRPLDTRSLMDLSLLITMLIPVVLAFLLYPTIVPIGNVMMWIAAALLINGLILYIPQFIATGNRDSRTLSRLQGLFLGLGGAMGVVPGISGVGAATSVSSVCGVDRNYGYQMTLLMYLGVCLGYVFFDVYGMVSGGAGSVGFGSLIVYLLAGLSAFCGTTLGIRLGRMVLNGIGFSVFAYYCWGLAFFTFIMSLLA